MIYVGMLEMLSAWQEQATRSATNGTKRKMLG